MAQSIPWCTTCCSRHKPGGDCPGSLLATGPERHTRKFTSISEDNQVEYYGVLIAQAGDHWRARILTHPNELWRVPGGDRTMKFSGTTASEAESRAIHYLEERCKEQDRSLTTTDGDAAVHRTARSGQDLRHRSKVPIRFGAERATQAATTANFSGNGIYIATDRLVAKGTHLHMSLTIQAYSVALTGTVVWIREQAEPGRPKGMGVRLEKPPALYLRYVDELREAVSKAEV